MSICSVGKFTSPADFVIVDYESDPRVPLILGGPFLQTARALINVHGEEMILYDGDKRLILNMRHDTSSYSNKPKKESINMIDIYHDPTKGNRFYSRDSLMSNLADELVDTIPEMFSPINLLFAYSSPPVIL
ncbi:hypothetical protein Tco_1114316 [Tanacetum coccineum]|uniref:Reverse transcriptase domain-containing protein n=1 Tax=Tanacetum coccineum TaxID=301880 RepID=A0ABQ5IXQ4_9ASTR